MYGTTTLLVKHWIWSPSIEGAEGRLLETRNWMKIISVEQMMNICSRHAHVKDRSSLVLVHGR
jgi:hypothetical protein